MSDTGKVIDQKWVYLKVYLGDAVDRIDWMVLEIESLVAHRDDIARWFFIRYLDEGGIHIRLRLLPRAEEAMERIRIEVIDALADRLSRISAQPPGDYAPMVSIPAFEDQIDAVMVAHNDVRVVEAEYEPEHDKFGGASGMPVAEQLFDRSSRIAAQILEFEAKGVLSRKSVIPRLMHETFLAFAPATDAGIFWREYSYYWLGAKTPAAEDWRFRFQEKSEQLAADGISLLAPHGQDVEVFDRIAEAWRHAVLQAAADYRDLGPRAAVNGEVLVFSFAHLMNNRLGIASLEEAYMAALLERAAKPEVAAA